MRYIAILITAFWLTMVGLLIRLQVNPEGSDVLTVPKEHIVNLMFVHGQPSDLSIYSSSNRRIGSVAIRPTRLLDTGERTLSFSGNTMVAIPGIQKQRIVWETHSSLEKDLSVREMRIQFSMREPDYQLSLVVKPQEKSAHYELLSGTRVVDSSDVTLTEKGFEDLLRQLGLDPSGMKALLTGSAPPEIKAKRTKFKVRSEEIDAYRITVHQGEQQVVEAFMSQLGQILLIKTSLGFRLVQDDIFP